MHLFCRDPCNPHSSALLFSSYFFMIHKQILTLCWCIFVAEIHATLVVADWCYWKLSRPCQAAIWRMSCHHSCPSHYKSPEIQPSPCSTYHWGIYTYKFTRVFSLKKNVKKIVKKIEGCLATFLVHLTKKSLEILLSPCSTYRLGIQVYLRNCASFQLIYTSGAEIDFRYAPKKRRNAHLLPKKIAKWRQGPVPLRVGSIHIWRQIFFLEFLTYLPYLIRYFTT